MTQAYAPLAYAAWLCDTCKTAVFEPLERTFFTCTVVWPLRPKKTPQRNGDRERGKPSGGKP